MSRAVILQYQVLFGRSRPSLLAETPLPRVLIHTLSCSTGSCGTTTGTLAARAACSRKLRRNDAKQNEVQSAAGPGFRVRTSRIPLRAAVSRPLPPHRAGDAPHTDCPKFPHPRTISSQTHTTFLKNFCPRAPAHNLKLFALSTCKGFLQFHLHAVADFLESTTLLVNL
jgi:hypothetical protein